MLLFVLGLGCSPASPVPPKAVDLPVSPGRETLNTPEPTKDLTSAVAPQVLDEPLPVADADGVFPLVVGGAVTQPKLIKRGDFDTDRFLGKRVPGGAIVAEMVISEDGTVRDVKLLRGLDESIDSEFLASAKKYLFEPATLDGKPVAVRYELLFRIEVR